VIGPDTSRCPAQPISLTKLSAAWPSCLRSEHGAASRRDESAVAGQRNLGHKLPDKPPFDPFGTEQGHDLVGKPTDQIVVLRLAGEDRFRDVGQEAASATPMVAGETREGAGGDVLTGPVPDDLAPAVRDNACADFSS
jgi:hypothetical protein